MTFARHTKTGIVDDVPDNILNHRVLGKNWEVISEDCEYEEDKVVVDKKVKITKTPKATELEDTEPIETQEEPVNYFTEGAEA